MCGMCRRALPKGSKFCAYCGSALPSTTDSGHRLGGKPALGAISAALFLCLLILLLPGIPAFICGLVAITGTVLFINRWAPQILRSFLAELGFAVVGMGLAIDASGWFVGEDFYHAVMQILNSFSDPARREFWHDPSMLPTAQYGLAMETKSDLGEEILQVLGATFIVIGACIVSLAALVALVRHSLGKSE